MAPVRRDAYLAAMSRRPEDPPSLDELVAARQALEHQLDRLRHPVTVVGYIPVAAPDNRRLIATLEAQWREIDTAIRGLQADED